MTRRRDQGGFAYIAAVVFLVFLAGLAVAALRLGGAQNATVNGTLQGMRASQAARGGLEWAFYQLDNGARASRTDVVDKRTLGDFADGHGFRVTLACRVYDYGEGEYFDPSDGTVKRQVKRVFELDATACNGAAATCPDAASVAGADYVERRRSASICVTATGGACY